MYGLFLCWLRIEAKLETFVLVRPPKIRVLSRYFGVTYKEKLDENP